ncbi:MAG: c-type cytochrome [Polyangiaceae bacterium]|nr:c-type cytochrome [Polyangiaceae bacterium]
MTGGATRVGDGRQGGVVVLAEQATERGRRLLAYVTDLDEPALRTIDVGSGRELAVTKLRGRGEQALVLADGRVAVTLRHDDLIEVLEPAADPERPLSSRCAVSVPAEPIALAATQDDRSLLVTSGYAHALTTLDGETLARRRTTSVAREPRAVVVADDGRRAFVSHVVGAKLSVVDLDGDGAAREVDLHQRLGRAGLDQRTAKLRQGCQGFALAKAIPSSPGKPPPPAIAEAPLPQPPPPLAGRPAPKPIPTPARPQPTAPILGQGRLFAPFVTVDPGEATRATSGYGDASSPLAAEVSSVSVIDAAAERAMTRAALTLSRREAQRSDCLLPRAARASGDALYVACLGIDSVLELDARALDPARAERRRWKVPAGPAGVAIDEATGTLVVASQFDRQLTILPLGEAATGGRQIALSRLSGPSVSPEVALGRALFHRTGDPMISSDGRACASCHPDGREDALTWSTPDGPRQTAMLAGRLEGTGPFSWSGAHPTLEDHVAHTTQRLGGTGLPNAQTQALLAYVKQLPAPRVGEHDDTVKRARVARGRELFFDAETACATCHTGAQTTDGARHDVGTRTSAERVDLETPSLRFVGATAPYFHDGRYATLLDVLEAPDSKMGHTTHLSRADRLALVAYLETL